MRDLLITSLTGSGKLKGLHWNNTDEIFYTLIYLSGITLPLKAREKSQLPCRRGKGQVIWGKRSYTWSKVSSRLGNPNCAGATGPEPSQKPKGRHGSKRLRTEKTSRSRHSSLTPTHNRFPHPLWPHQDLASRRNKCHFATILCSTSNRKTHIAQVQSMKYCWPTLTFQLFSLHIVNDSPGDIILKSETQKRTQGSICLKNCMAIYLVNFFYFIRKNRQFNCRCDRFRLPSLSILISSYIPQPPPEKQYGTGKKRSKGRRLGLHSQHC
ncbi:uncharacterized protein LOC134739549 [Pongo pygmaeus]|uniref:uncharacterized protein LOC134739549 n=1 Tax=Pongo pygmaeus TaxID=9600 RepID=UPI00300CD874